MSGPESSFWGLVKSHLPPDIDYQRIETGGTGLGIPDVNICDAGRECWVETKIVDGNRVKLSPEQVAWHWRRTRVGGKTWILARKKQERANGTTIDDIYLWPGHRAPQVKEKGIHAEGGIVWSYPFQWNEIIRTILRRDL